MVKKTTNDAQAMHMAWGTAPYFVSGTLDHKNCTRKVQYGEIGSQSHLGIKGLKIVLYTKIWNEENINNPSKKQQNAVFIFKHSNLNLKVETKKILQKTVFPCVL